MTTIYPTSKPATALAPLLGEQERTRFLVGTCTIGPNTENEIHLIDYEDTGATQDVSTHIYTHPAPISSISPCPAKSDLLFTVHNAKASLWVLSAQEVDDAGRLKECDPKFMSELLQLGEDVGINDIIWDPNGKSLENVISYNHNELHVWALDRALSKGTISSRHQCPQPSTTKNGPVHINDAAWSPHSTNLVYLAYGPDVVGIDIRSGSVTTTIPQAHTLLTRCIDINPNRAYHIITGGDDTKIRIWDVRMVNSNKSIEQAYSVERQGCLKEISEHTHWVTSLSYNPYHDQLLLSGSTDNLVHLHSVVSVSSAKYSVDGEGTPIDTLITTTTHNDSITNISWSNADPWVWASLSNDGRVIVGTVPRTWKERVMGV